VIDMEDKTLICRDCGREFTFSASEQQFYAEKGFTNEPGRCPECRAAHKAQRVASGRTSGGYSTGPREMFPAVCAQCGKQTQVPFEPHGDRPVYCSDCFAQQRGTGGSSRRSGGRNRSW